VASRGTVVDAGDLAPGQLRALELGGRRVVLCNAHGRYYALEDRCPHAAVALSGGRLDGHELECPHHGGRIDVRDGRPVRPPIRRPAQTFAVRSVEGGLEISLDPGA